MALKFLDYFAKLTKHFYFNRKFKKWTLLKKLDSTIWWICCSFIKTWRVNLCNVWAAPRLALKKMVLTFFDYFAKLVKHFGWHPKSEKWTLLSKSCTIFWLRLIISFDDLCDVCANEMKIVLAWLSYFVKLRSTMLFNYNHSWIWFTSYLYRAPHVELYNRIGTRWWNLTKTADNFRVEMSNKFPRSEGQSVRFLWRLYHRYNM